MNKTLELYDLYPKVVPTHQPSKLTLKALDYSVRFEEGETYTVMILPLCESTDSQIGLTYPTYSVVAHENTLLITHTFGNEQEYYIRLLTKDHKRIMQLSVYALEQDLYSCRPYKGDLHVHSCFSDGLESPEFVAAKYRQHGFDFLAITDHHRMHPSIRAIETYKNLPLGIKLFQGEEVHCPDNHVHIVNFGGDYSVNDLFLNDPDTYYKEVKALEETLQLPDSIPSFSYASCLWAYNHIKSAHGLGIFAHPQWIANVYHVSDAMTTHHFTEQPFDAFELVGGQTQKENNMQISLFNDIQTKLGKHIPVVGSSDSHGVLDGYLFNQMKTVVISTSCEKNDLITAIKALHSVAIEDYTNEHYRVHGNHRLVSYVIFLMENYFPIHDELCFEEGRAMLDYIRGNETYAKSILQLTQDRMEILFGKYFGRCEF